MTGTFAVKTLWNGFWFAAFLGAAAAASARPAPEPAAPEVAG